MSAQTMALPGSGGPSPRETYGVIEAEFGTHLLDPDCGICDVGTTILCPEGERLADAALAAATLLHVLEGRR